MSLIKYTVFTNSLLTELQDSSSWCKIYRTPSTTLGYSDDLAACCALKQRMDRSMKNIYRHRCTWRYKSNAKESEVWVNGERAQVNK